MCQLLGMNCNVPTDICFSFTGFRRRGGATDVHTDGWGIAFFEGRGVRLFLDPQPSASSAIADFVRHYPIHSLNVIAHIRKASQGPTSLQNTHPFQREMWGRYWVFAHNGNLPGFRPELDGSYLPVGDTDSEWAFCWLLQKLRQRYGLQMPPREELFACLAELTCQAGAQGVFNYLLSNGDCLVGHCSTELSYIIRCAPFAKAHLKDEDLQVDFSQVTTPEDRVAVVATQPLTDNEVWNIMPPGTLCLFHHGQVLLCRHTVAGPVSGPSRD